MVTKTKTRTPSPTCTPSQVQLHSLFLNPLPPSEGHKAAGERRAVHYSFSLLFLPPHTFFLLHCESFPWAAAFFRTYSSAAARDPSWDTVQVPAPPWPSWAARKPLLCCLEDLLPLTHSFFSHLGVCRIFSHFFAHFCLPVQYF